jgi:glycosyltransferase involved in cell wall biosynthesis
MAKANSRHPLPMSLVADDEEVVFDSRPSPVTGEAQAGVAQDAACLKAELAQLGVGLAADAIDTFVASRDIASQAMMQGDHDLLFLHTSPMTLGARPWILHVETLITIFEPFFGQFRTWDIDLDREPAYHMVRHLLRSPRCCGIFTHIARSRDDLPLLLAEEALARKVFYAPLGIDVPPAVAAAVPAAIASRNAKAPADEIVLLYTNSWHQHPASFYARGGHDLLLAFGELCERHPDRPCRLILRTALPESLGAGLIAAIRSHPRITLIEQPVSDEELFALLLQADVFVLPSANLHSISILRAMATGAVVLSADAFAVDEFIADGETGVIVSGRRGVTYREDRARGLLRERGELLFSAEGGFRPALTTAMERVLLDAELRRTVRGRALDRVRQRHSLAPWRSAFHAMLNAILRP